MQAELIVNLILFLHMPNAAMIVSPSQDSFYNGFPGYSQVEDSAFSALPKAALQDPTPVAWPPGTFQGISSRVTTSELIASPSEEGEKKKMVSEEDRGKNNPEIHHFETKPQSSKHGLKFTSFSDPNIETITELDIETESPNEGSGDTAEDPTMGISSGGGSRGDDTWNSTMEAFPRGDLVVGSGNSTAGTPRGDAAGVSRNDAAGGSINSAAEGYHSGAGPPGGSTIEIPDVSGSRDRVEGSRDSATGSTSGEVPQSREARRLFMQASIERGMQDIMAKVVSETKQNSPDTRRPHSRSHTAPSSIHIPIGEEHTAQSHRKMQVRTLICSPMTSTTDLKRYPNFVFTPASSKTSVSDQEAQGHDEHNLNGFERHEQKEGYNGSPDEEDNWFGEDMDNDDGWLGSGSVKERVSDDGRGGEGENRRLVKHSASKGVQVRSLLDKADAIVSPLPLEDTGGGKSQGNSPQLAISRHNSTEGSTRTRKSLFHIKQEDPIFPEVVIMQASPSRFFEALPRQHYHSAKSLASAPASNSQYKTEMELVKPISAFLNHKFSSNRPLKSAMNHSVSTNDLSVEKSATIFSSDLKVDKAGTDSISNLGMRRCCTDVSVKRTSVTKLKRPHSFHVSKSKDGSGAIDFTKDEFIRRAALQGMTRKPRSRRQSQDAPISSHRVTPCKDKEMVSDLDNLLLQRKASNKSTALSSLTEGKGSTVKLNTGQQYFTKYVSDKRRLVSRSNTDTKNADLPSTKRQSCGELRSMVDIARSSNSKSRAENVPNENVQSESGGRNLGGVEGKTEVKEGERAQEVLEEVAEGVEEGRDGWKEERRKEDVQAVVERRSKVVVEVLEEWAGGETEKKMTVEGVARGEVTGYEEGVKKDRTEEEKIAKVGKTAERELKDHSAGKDGDRNEGIGDRAGEDSEVDESVRKEREEANEQVKNAEVEEQNWARGTAQGEGAGVEGKNWEGEVGIKETAWEDGDSVGVEEKEGFKTTAKIAQIEEWKVQKRKMVGDWMGEGENKILRPQSAPVTPGNYQEAAYIIQHEPEKLCWTQF